MGLGVLAAGALAVPALASQTVKIGSEVTLAARGADCNSNGACHAILFHGRVESTKHACEVHRTVKVIETSRPGGRKPDKLVGKDSSNHRDRWKVVQPLTMHFGPGFYYAKVLRREVGTAGTICRADRSKVFDLH
jgi:hypothetical protein